LLYLYRIDKPSAPFWDENYYIATTERYKAGLAHLESHPPIGLMLIAAGDWLTGANSTLSTAPLARERHVSGDQIPKGYSFVGIRLFPSLFAILCIAAFFALLRRCSGSDSVALAASVLLLVENSFITHFRAAHLDSIQLFFVLCTIYQLVVVWKRNLAIGVKDFAIFGALCAAATLVKVNSVFLLALAPVMLLRDLSFVRSASRYGKFDRVFTNLGGLSGGAIAVCFAVFALHTILGSHTPDRNSPSGQVTWAHSSDTYKAYYTGQEGLSFFVVLHVIRDYGRFMNQDHRGVPKLDICKPGENGSHPTSWPLNRKTINYRWDSSDGRTSYVQLVGNQVNWAIGLIGVILAISITLARRIFKSTTVDHRVGEFIELILGLYLLYMAIVFYMAEQRVMYLYHYFVGLLLSLMLAGLSFKAIIEIHRIKRVKANIILVTVALASTANFAWLAPLSLHYPLTKAECEARNFLQRVVECQ